LLHLLQEILEVPGGLARLFLKLEGLLPVDDLLGLFDERDDVAHAQDLIGHALGMERLERLELLTGAHELDRATGNADQADGRAAARIAVQLGQHDARQGQRIVELLRAVDGVLPGHGVGDKQDFVRRHLALDAADLGHHLLVHVQTAGGVHDDDVALAHLGFPARHHARVHGVGVFPEAETLDTGLLRHDFQLLDGRRAVDIRGHQEGFVALFLQMQRDLACAGRFSLTLQPHHHDEGRSVLCESQGFIRAAHGPHERVVNNLDDLLARLDALEHFLPERLLLDVRDELLDNLIVNVGLEQRPADFLEAVLHVFLGQFSLTANILEGGFQPFCQRFEHSTRTF